jgi:hypothetical protein
VYFQHKFSLYNMLDNFPLLSIRLFQNITILNFIRLSIFSKNLRCIFIKYIKSIFDEIGLSFIWNDQIHIKKDLVKSIVKQKLFDQFIQVRSISLKMKFISNMNLTKTTYSFMLRYIWPSSGFNGEFNI